MAFLGHGVKSRDCRLRGWRIPVGLLAAGFLLLWGAAGLRAETGNEYELKAAFLYKFANYIEWPALAAGEPIAICTVGQHPFGDMVEQAVRGQLVNGHAFVVKHFKTGQEAKDCQIAFIGEAGKEKLRAILESLAGQAILTVGESEGFCESGGVIGLELVDKKVRFMVNVEAAERARLKVGSRLLGLAKIVRDPAH